MDKKERKKRAVIWWFTGMAAGIFALIMFWPGGNIENKYVPTGKVEMEKEYRIYGELECAAKDQSSAQLDSVPFWYYPVFIDFNWGDFMNFNNGWEMPYYGSNYYEMPDVGYENNWNLDNFTGLFNAEIEKMKASEIALIPNQNQMANLIPVKEKRQKRAWIKELQVYSGKSVIPNIYFTSADNLNTDSSPDTGTVALNSQESLDVDNSVRKSLPVSVNLLMGKRFGRFEILAGLGVNYFSETTISNNIQNKNHHFGINIPMQTRFNFVDLKRSKVFVDLGGNLELPIFKETYQANTANTGSVKIGLQAGVKAGLGYAYILNERNSISISPEVRYYLTQKNEAYGNSTQPPWCTV